MSVEEVIGGVREIMTVRRVFGEPYEKEGVTVIPAARVRGGAGGGGGEGTSEQGQGRGSGSGYAVNATPAGVYVIRGDQVRWQPAVDVNRIAAGGQLVAVVALLTLRAYLKLRGERIDASRRARALQALRGACPFSSR
ncbi:MAG TPA: spore germination protein GerW family protein [Actinomycetota bacterium]|nr:spore germination protein GerW family protein [Actinomycetota bacterium]